MLSYHSSYEYHILYFLVRDFALKHPFLHWLCVGVGTVLLLSLLFLGIACQKRKSTVYLYALLVLGSVATLDILTQTIPMLAVYLIAQGIVLYRTQSKSNIAITLIFATVFLVIDSFTTWNKYMLIELMGEVLLFIGVAWTLLQLKQSNHKIEHYKEKNQYLADKVRENQKRLKEYHDTIEDTYRRDYLTGLYNFGGFKEQVIQSLVRCGPDQYYHVVCVDLADFRQVNMEEGLEFGDQILMLLARQLKKNLPHFAKLARYDGDQFAIGIIGDRSVLRLCLDTIERVMEEIKADRTLVNYCVGTATYPLEAKSADELIRLAEQRLSIEQRRLRHREEEHRQRLEKLSAVGQLAAGLAHEIRNPLTSIRGFVQISAAENMEVKKWESIILPEIDRINDLLKQFLNLSETKPARYQEFSLDQLVKDVMSLLQPKSFLMGHEIKVIAPSKAVMIEADAEQIKQVIINLIQNGLESLMDHGKVEVKWKELHGRVMIRIQDNGCGIKPEHFSRIFEPFFTTKGEGTGMGLSICHRIINDHGGQVHVTSQPGRGTTFNIHLPLRQVRKQIVSEIRHLQAQLFEQQNEHHHKRPETPQKRMSKPSFFLH
ncbi:diguanylate cyclase (GGDEF) domain-containing protein [Seinonella peptonophila]|uniref:histidine kinase n=1 Tax=Seinonella peptonophila TaxID=112248 RepID=A0A1M4WWZ7_9BACL|nr:ATP-binding protein [Seinonella peptonophila]SHE85667.1 diguanylate cyclase (GGDEF) domain-containing protein [Seinonella peptonophila]